MGIYLRRHCYDKPWRCPGWAGGGWKYPRYRTKPVDWDDEAWERSRSGALRSHWWHPVKRCYGGTLWDARFGDDPWAAFRWHHCTECDVRAIPHVLRWLDPSWWRHVIMRDIGWSLRDIRDHRLMWMEPARAPWWSMPYVAWRTVRSIALSRWWSVTDWCRKLYRWHAPRFREERARELVDLKAHYGVK